MARFSLIGLAAIRGERRLFAGLDLELTSGAALVLTGPNGSGKSTLIRLLAGLSRPADGKIVWDGTDIAEDFSAHHARLHFVGHQDAIRPALTLSETLEFWSALGGAAISGTEIETALGVLGLAALADSPCRFLSAGQKRRLALARLLTSKRPLWLLDEPAVGLDAAALTAVGNLIQHHRDGGGMVILSTHQDLAIPNASTLHLEQVAARAA